jgi:hypothetical protein
VAPKATASRSSLQAPEAVSASASAAAAAPSSMASATFVASSKKPMLTQVQANPESDNAASILERQSVTHFLESMEASHAVAATHSAATCNDESCDSSCVEQDKVHTGETKDEKTTESWEEMMSKLNQAASILFISWCESSDDVASIREMLASDWTDLVNRRGQSR